MAQRSATLSLGSQIKTHTLNRLMHDGEMCLNENEVVSLEQAQRTIEAG
jgi:hypothetical protein